jgi:hypothetical protein
VDHIVHGLVLHSSGASDGVLVNLGETLIQLMQKIIIILVLASKAWYERSVSSAVSFLL